MKKKLLYLLSVSLFSLPSCAFNNINSGSFYMRVKFPENNAFSIKAIPDNTSSILVRVDGDGIEAKKPITFELTKDDNVKLINLVPVGYKSVNVTAIDSQGVALATGSSTVDVKENTVNKVEVELNPLEIPPAVELPCIINFPSTEAVSDSLRKSVEDAGCSVEIK